MKENSEEKLDRKDKKSKHTKSGYGIGMKMSLDLVSSIIAGSLIGLGIDIFFSTKPIFFIIFLVLGIIAGFFGLYKTVKNINKI
tara:strand:+ start:258 stop:509 length:252 start_codon:yes stop_codon:yes gene_type:complete